MRSRLLLLALAASALTTTLRAAGSGMESTSDPGSAHFAPACIAIVMPSVHGVEGSSTDVANGLRDLVQQLSERTVEFRAVALDTRLALQAIEEAREKQCDHILITTLTRKRSGGNGRLGQAVGSAVGTAAWQISGISAGAAVARGAAVGGAQAVSTIWRRRARRMR